MPFNMQRDSWKQVPLSITWLTFTFKLQNQIIQGATVIDISSFQIFLSLLFKTHISKHFKNSHKKILWEFPQCVQPLAYVSLNKGKVALILVCYNFHASNQVLPNILHTNEPTPNRNQEFANQGVGWKGNLSNVLDTLHWII